MAFSDKFEGLGGPTITPAIMDIVDLSPKAEKIDIHDLAKTDLVFDVWGKMYVLKNIRHFVHGVRITREDGVQSWFDYEMSPTITVMRGA